jgi:methylmalonyl-CoA mutase cobalamin-binding domain/chain
MRIFALLDEFPERPDFVIVAGGVMPDEDEAELKRMGVAEVLGQDTTPETIVATIRELARAQAARA